MRNTRPFLVMALTALIATMLVAPAAAKGGPPDAAVRGQSLYSVDLDDLEAKAAELDADFADDAVDTLHGVLAGAGWIAQVPADWNGELLIWAHGYRGEATDPGGDELTVDEAAAHEWLVDHGYAWAASSYQRNSYDPGVGVLDTQRLTQHVQSVIGQADKTYLAGVSMGGHVTAAAIERFPNQWDGALPACGVLGDVELFDYFLDYNLGAAAFAGLADPELDYPAQLTYPDDRWVSDEVVDIKMALAGTSGPFWAFSPSPALSPFKDFVELGSGGERSPFFDAGWQYWHSLDPNFFFSLGEGDGTIAGRKGVVGQNSDTDWAEEYGSLGALIEGSILEVTADDRVRKSQGQKPAPIIDGTPPVPVLAMHTLGDLFVPIEMLQLYANEVAANGLADRLVTRTIRDVGHCTFTDGEWAEAYADLFAWVADPDDPDARPEGEPIDEFSALSGCAFTLEYALPLPFFRSPFDFCPSTASG